MAMVDFLCAISFAQVIPSINLQNLSPNKFQGGRPTADLSPWPIGKPYLPRLLTFLRPIHHPPNLTPPKELILITTMTGKIQTTPKMSRVQRTRNPKRRNTNANGPLKTFIVTKTAHLPDKCIRKCYKVGWTLHLDLRPLGFLG